MESMAKAYQGETMTYGYDLELMIVALENVENTAQGLVSRHRLDDWLAYRLAHIRAEARSLRVEIEKTKGSCNG